MRAPSLGRRSQDAGDWMSGLSAVFAAALVAGCASSRAPSGELTSSAEFAAEFAGGLGEFSSKGAFLPTRPVGCRQLFDAYCTALYSPRSAGNLRVPQSEGPAMILQGQTTNNLPAVFVSYAQAKLRRQGRLPADFAAALGRRQYFTRLKQILSRKPRAQMTIVERVEADQLEHEVASDWTSAIDEAVLRRLRRKFPDYHALADVDVPIEWQLERRRTRRALASEIAIAIWGNDPNWRKVESGFASLRESFLQLIDDLDAPESLRDAWRSRVKAVELVLPGSRPSVSDDECAATKKNAYYYSYLNLLTVCAGDFNGEDIMQTLAHEMAHALDLDRSRYLFQSSSPFGRAVVSLRRNVCGPREQFSCAEWQEFKRETPARLAALRSYRAELPEFNRCLSRRASSSRRPFERVTEAIARASAARETRERFADLASSNYFLRIIKERIPLPSGKLQRNPNWLNPCSYYMWSSEEEPIDDGLSTLVFFTAEYRCSEGSDADRLRSAIAKAHEMTTATLTESILNEGEFSNRRSLEVEGLAASPAERFADVVGSHALARSIGQMDLVWERRNAFLASSSWQCEPPGLASSFPTESSVQREWQLDAHSEGRERVHESLSLPIREKLLCEKDFEFDECELPLRKPASTRAPATENTDP